MPHLFSFAPTRSAARPLRPSPLALAAALLVAAFAIPAGLGAQTVRGALTGADNGRPVPGALVALVDAAGRAVATVVSDAEGRWRLAAPGAGTYALRVERIGHRTLLTERFALAAGQTRDHPLALPTDAITLEGIRAEARRRCTTRGERRDGLALQRVWDEARKALALTVATASDSLAGYEFTTFERTYSPRERRLVGETTATRRGLTSRPFHSLPVEELAENGFVQARDRGLVFYAPDADVLLSDRFLERHCFRLQEGSGETAGMIGLAFEPVRGRRRPDVRGVLWLDRRTSELRHLEFGYVGVHAAGGASADGRVDFVRTPSGAWIVRSWLLRFPVADLHLSTDLHTNYRLSSARVLKEVGGTVVRGWAPADSAARER
ncbi:MAG TPA: carboxypeptidase-like regulatory domain-containing protein [Longimicrobium sp.]|jgi:hypothetical protein